MANLTDHQLIKLVRQAKLGNERAFDKILKELEPDMKKKINRFYIRGGESADVLQEARIGLWKAIEDFNEDGGMAFRYFAVNLCVPRRLITQISSANRNKFKLQNDAISLSTPVRTEVEDSEQSLADFIQDDESNMLDYFRGPQKALRDELAAAKSFKGLDEKFVAALKTFKQSWKN
mgnify:CR=1 FL=1